VNSQGVPVFQWYDSVGKTTWESSLDCLRPLGLMVSFGNTTGAVPPFAISQLAAKGSLYVTRPILDTYVARREDLEASSQDVFEMVASGKLKVGVRQTYALKDAAQAHRDLEAGKSTGSTVLLP